MSVDQKKILIRQGNKADLVVTSLQPGESVLALDTNEVGVKASGGDMLWFATAGGGANKAVLASEKGVKGGTATLDPITGKLAQMPDAADVKAVPVDGFIDRIYPVGSIYISTKNTNPGTLFGGTWASYSTGKTLIGVDPNDSDFSAANKTDGSKSHTHGLTSAVAAIDLNIYGNLTELKQNSPSNYTITGYRSLGTLTSGGGDQSFGTGLIGNTDSESSLPPYITCYMWQRTA